MYRPVWCDLRGIVQLRQAYRHSRGNFNDVLIGRRNRGVCLLRIPMESSDSVRGLHLFRVRSLRPDDLLCNVWISFGQENFETHRIPRANIVELRSATRLVYPIVGTGCRLRCWVEAPSQPPHRSGKLWQSPRSDSGPPP